MDQPTLAEPRSWPRAGSGIPGQEAQDPQGSVPPFTRGQALFYESDPVRRFVGLRLTGPLPDEATILHFRHLLERNSLGRDLMEEINAHLESQGLKLRAGIIVDASIIEQGKPPDFVMEVASASTASDYTGAKRDRYAALAIADATDGPKGAPVTRPPCVDGKPAAEIRPILLVVETAPPSQSRTLSLQTPPI